MSIRPVRFGDTWIQVEVADEAATQAGPSEGGERIGDLVASPTSVASEAADRAERVNVLLRAVLAPIGDAARSAGPKEWSVELLLGFEGGASIPFLTSTKANASIKVTAKWIA